eukprot:XP_007106362.1 rho GTPase-activating protein 24-like [Physeter catodon]
MEESNDSMENPQQGQGRNNAMKCGWLRKQGGFVKTWHTRWFVLKGDQLYYFKDEDETKPLEEELRKSVAAGEGTWYGRAAKYVLDERKLMDGHCGEKDQCERFHCHNFL